MGAFVIFMKRKILLSVLFTLTLATTWLVYSLSAQTITPEREPEAPTCKISGSVISGTIDITLMGDCAGVDLGGLITPILSPPILANDIAHEDIRSDPQVKTPGLLNLLDDDPAPTPELQGVEAAFGPLWAEIEAAQEGFYELYGRYWQGLTIGPGIVPTYPSDQAMTWEEFLSYTPSPTYTLEISSYIGPLGPGYFAELNYNSYTKIVSVGLLDLDKPWTLNE